MRFLKEARSSGGTSSEADDYALLDALPDLFFRVSRNGIILEGEFGFFRCLTNNFVGKHLREIFPSEAAEILITAIEHAFVENEVQTREFELEIESKKESWEARIIALNSKEALLVVHDITDSMIIKRSLTEARLELANLQKTAALGVMAGNIAHEVNQPLNSIKVAASGLLYLFNKGITVLPAQINHELERILQEVDRVDQVIIKTRQLVHNVAPQKVPLEFNAIIKQVLLRVKDEKEFEGIEFVFNSATPPAWIEGDELQMEQVLLNLLSNAAHALAKQEEKKVLISVEVNGKVGLTIADNGPGLPEKLKESLFEPFITEGKNPGNLGLGLSIVKSILNAYGGEITAGDMPGGGAVFHIELKRLDRELIEK